LLLLEQQGNMNSMNTQVGLTSWLLLHFWYCHSSHFPLKPWIHYWYWLSSPGWES